MKRIERQHGWSYVWGVFKSSPIDGISWEVDPSTMNQGCRPKIAPSTSIPSWSWASLDGPISYGQVLPHGLSDSDPRQVDLDFLNLETELGLMILSGRILMLTMNAKFVDYRDSGRWEYDVVGVGRGLVRVDLPLRLGDKNVPLKAEDQPSGRYLPTVTRVPYGEEPPKEPWSGHCLCVLVSKTRLRVFGLLMGYSPRVPIALERIGTWVGDSA